MFQWTRLVQKIQVTLRIWTLVLHDYTCTPGNDLMQFIKSIRTISSRSLSQALASRPGTLDSAYNSSVVQQTKYWRTQPSMPHITVVICGVDGWLHVRAGSVTCTSQIWAVRKITSWIGHLCKALVSGIFSIASSRSRAKILMLTGLLPPCSPQQKICQTTILLRRRN